MYIIIIIAVVIVFLSIKSYLHLKEKERQLLRELEQSYGKANTRKFEPGELDRISRKFRNKCDDPDKKSEFIIDDITWNDMDMDEVFMAMGHCGSGGGEEYLYDMLRRPVFDDEVLKERDRVAVFFDKNPKNRLAFQRIFYKLGKTGKYSLSDQLMKISVLKEDSNILHFFCIFLTVLSISLIYIKPPVGFFAILITAAFNVATYFKRKGELEPYISSFIYLFRALNEADEMLSLPGEGLEEYMEKIRNYRKQLLPIRRGSFLIVAGNGATGGILDLPLDYIRIFMHLDLIKFNLSLKQFIQKKNIITELFDTMGFLDAEISIASFRNHKKIFCAPAHEFSDSSNYIFNATGLYHPLVNDAIPYDIITKGGVLITGANASGKSTFLKSVGLAVILGQTINTAFSVSCNISYMTPISAIKVEDSIKKGDSYYMAEIKAVKRLIDAGEFNSIHGKVGVICFIDELLRGTNTIERISAAAEILKVLRLKNFLVLSATHDIELAVIIDKYYDNFHFSETIEQDDIKFDYKLRPGMAKSRNAISLLKLIGFDDEITSKAYELAASYEKDGSWERI
ncbi:MAG: hypothetical protein K6F99_02720 [Lachnospiraceae bacterium]|nr:hypothetical protein [Lachnospiraceae bacterium]